MDGCGLADILLFEGFRFDPCGGGLFRLDKAGIAAPVALGSRALELLGLLVTRRGELVCLAEKGGRGSQPKRPDFKAAPHP